MELFSPGHLIPLLIIALVLFFGWKQLPDMARSLGRSLRIFKTEIKGLGEDDAVRDAAKAPPALEPPAAEKPGETANGAAPATTAQTDKPAASGQ